MAKVTRIARQLEAMIMNEAALARSVPTSPESASPATAVIRTGWSTNCRTARRPCVRIGWKASRRAFSIAIAWPSRLIPRPPL
jgi:hypothetical protein